jgi:UDP-glucuronate decarboxylase
MTIDEQLQSICDGVGFDVHQFSGKTVLITGSCGFLGSWFTALFQYLNQKYLKEPVQVIGIDSYIATDQKNYITELINEHIFIEKGDCADKFQLQGIIGDRQVDFVIHAAGIASPIFYRKYPIETIEGMALGLINLFKTFAELPLKGVLVFSSSEMYGNPLIGNVPTPETYNGNVSATGPRSCYDEAKRLEETLCVAYHKVHNIPVNWVRPFNVYGPGMRVNDDRVVPKFIFQGLRGEEFTVHNPGKQTRTFCYVTDAMIGFLKVLLHPVKGEVYNIGNDSPELTIKQLADEVNQKLFNGLIKIKGIDMPEEYPIDQAQRRCPDLTKARKELNYEPKIDLDLGLKMSLEWAKTQKYES